MPTPLSDIVSEFSVPDAQTILGVIGILDATELLLTRMIANAERERRHDLASDLHTMQARNDHIRDKLLSGAKQPKP